MGPFEQPQEERLCTFCRFSFISPRSPLVLARTHGREVVEQSSGSAAHILRRKRPQGHVAPCWRLARGLARPISPHLGRLWPGRVCLVAAGGLPGERGSGVPMVFLKGSRQVQRLSPRAPLVSCARALPTQSGTCLQSYLSVFLVGVHWRRRDAIWNACPLDLPVVGLPRSSAFVLLRGERRSRGPEPQPVEKRAPTRLGGSAHRSAECERPQRRRSAAIPKQEVSRLRSDQR